MRSALRAFGADLVRPRFAPPGSFQGRVPRGGVQVGRPFNEALTLPVRVSALTVGSFEIESNQLSGGEGGPGVSVYKPDNEI